MNKKAILGLVIIFLSILALMMTCKKGFFAGQNVTKPQNKISEIIDDKKKQIAKIDSLEHLLKIKDDSLKLAEVKIEHHYHTVYKTIYQSAPDTCKPLLEQLNNEHEKIDSVKNQRIITLEKRINEKEQKESAFNDIISLKDYQMTVSHDSIVDLKTQLKTSEKKVARERAKGWLKTILSSALSGAAGYGAGKIMP